MYVIVDSESDSIVLFRSTSVCLMRGNYEPLSFEEANQELDKLDSSRYAIFRLELM